MGVVTAEDRRSAGDRTKPTVGYQMDTVGAQGCSWRPRLRYWNKAPSGDQGYMVRYQDAMARYQVFDGEEGYGRGPWLG